MIGQVAAAGPLEIMMGVQGDCDADGMDINRMQFSEIKCKPQHLEG